MTPDTAILYQRSYQDDTWSSVSEVHIMQELYDISNTCFMDES